MEHWGCPWNRTADGRANVRAFGGMKIERTWFAADKHRLSHAAHAVPDLAAACRDPRFDEHFCLDLIVDEGRVHGVVALQIATGEFCRSTRRP